MLRQGKLFQALQKLHDGIIRVTLGNFLDRLGISPNHITFFRIILVLLVWVLWTINHPFSAFLIFVLQAWLDVIDGAHARTSKKFIALETRITELETEAIAEAIKLKKEKEFGKILDPLADKLSIITALFLVGFSNLGLFISSAVILAEVATAMVSHLIARLQVVAYLNHEEREKFLTSTVFGKIKFLLEFFAISLLFLHESLPSFDGIFKSLAKEIFAPTFTQITPVLTAQILTMLSLVFAVAAWRVHYLDYFQLLSREKSLK